MGGNFGLNLNPPWNKNAAEYFINLKWIWLSKDFLLILLPGRVVSDNMSKQYFRHIKYNPYIANDLIIYGL